MNTDKIRKVIEGLPGNPRVRVFEEDIFSTGRFAMHFNCHHSHMDRLRKAIESIRPEGIQFVYKPMGYAKLRKATYGLRVAYMSGSHPYGS